ARGDLSDVDARNRPEQIGEVLRRGGRDRIRSDDRNRGRCVDELFLRLRRRYHDGFFVLLRLIRRLFFRFLLIWFLLIWFLLIRLLRVGLGLVLLGLIGLL